MPSVTIPARFNGPQGSANGGYACGSVAALVEGPARVRLHRPPPLDRAMTAQVQPNGTVLVTDEDEQVIATAQPVELPWNGPPAPPLEQAAEARTHYRGRHQHIYPRCFVCGPQREPGDGLRVFAGPVSGRDELVACDFHPGSTLVDAHGHLRPEIVWAALDCPSYFALGVGPERPFLLGQMSAALEPDLPGAEPLVVYAWARGQEGRKHLAAAALANASGQVLAWAEHVWIELASTPR